MSCFIKCDLLKAKQGFRQGFPNWLKLSHIVQQCPNTLITIYCDYTPNRNKLVHPQKFISSSKVGACANAHLPLPLPVRLRSSAHHTDKSLIALIHIRFAQSQICCHCKAYHNVTYLLWQSLFITDKWPDCFQYTLNIEIMLWKYVRSRMENQHTHFEKFNLETSFQL